MVNNLNKILDAGEIISMAPVKMKQPNYVKEFIAKLTLAKPVAECMCHDRWEELGEFTKEQTDAYDWFRDHHHPLAMHYFSASITPKDYKVIAKLQGVEPFRDSVMINISPNWKGEYGQNPIKDKLMVKGMKNSIDNYLSEQIDGEPRYTNYKYCIECGSEGNFLHAHIVAEINPKLLKGMITHINKGNHTQQLKKYWDKNFGLDKNGQGCFKGALKGKFSVQRIMIKNEIILKDKLKYLKEENKQAGHTNLKDLKLRFGDLKYTSK